jgi:flagellar motor switch protein FliM
MKPFGIKNSERQRRPCYSLDMGQILEAYNFKKPRALTEKEIFTVRTTTETFARLVSVGLSIHLCVEVDVKVDPKIEQKSFRDFFDQIETPSIRALFNFDPLDDKLILQLSPSLSSTISLLSFGGHVEGTKAEIHDLSDMELSVMEGILVRLLGNLREAWSSHLDARPRLSYVETNPLSFHEIPRESFWLQIQMEIKMGEAEGALSLYFPQSFFDSFAEFESSFTKQISIQSINPKMAENLRIERYDAHQIKALSMEEILNLKIGDTIIHKTKERRLVYKTNRKVMEK